LKKYFLLELKKIVNIRSTWRYGDEMTGDVFTKNLPPSLFEYHGHKFYGTNEYSFESKDLIG
jgi:hypothetical protein